MRAVATVLVLSLVSAVARAAEPSAAEIIERSRQTSALGIAGAKAEVKLTVDDGHGGVKERHLSAVSARLSGETRRLVRFLDPADVSGVGVLVIEKEGQPAERLLYLPSQKRIRRVSGKQGGQSFQETDFSYADLDLAGGRGDEVRRERDEQVDGDPCWVVTTVPVESPYGKVVTYVNQKTSVPLQILFYDKDGATLLKRLKASRVKQVDGRWYVIESVMESPARGSRTTLAITHIDVKTPVSPDDVSEQALEKP